MTRKHGFVYLLILMAVIAVVFFASTIFNLNQNLRTQVSHIAYKDVSFSSAYSILSGILARVYKSGWQDRFFAAKPVQVYGLALGEASCDYYIEDTPNFDHQMDVYIRVNLTGRSQLYFWRVVYHDEIFDFSIHFSSIFFTNPDSKEFPPENNGVTIASEVDAMLVARAENEERARQTIATVIEENDTVRIARNLGAPIPKIPQESEAFSAQFPISGGASPEFPPAVARPPEEGPPMSLPQPPPDTPPDTPPTTASLPPVGNPEEQITPPRPENFPGENAARDPEPVAPLPPGILPGSEPEQQVTPTRPGVSDEPTEGVLPTPGSLPKGPETPGGVLPK